MKTIGKRKPLYAVLWGVHPWDVYLDEILPKRAYVVQRLSHNTLYDEI